MPRFALPHQLVGFLVIIFSDRRQSDLFAGFIEPERTQLALVDINEELKQLENDAERCCKWRQRHKREIDGCSSSLWPSRREKLDSLCSTIDNNLTEATDTLLDKERRHHYAYRCNGSESDVFQFVLGGE